MNSPHIAHLLDFQTDLSGFLNKMSKARVLVVGDIMLDVYRVGGAVRISPEAPVPVLLNPTIEYRLGGAGAVAAMCAALGAEVFLAGVLGQDPQGRQTQRLLATAGVHWLGSISSDRPTTTKERICGVASGRHRQQLCRVDLEDDSPLPTDLAEALANQIMSFGCIGEFRGRGFQPVNLPDLNGPQAGPTLDAFDRLKAFPTLAVHSLAETCPGRQRNPTPDIVLVSDYAKGVCVTQILNAIRSLKLPAIVDPPKYRDWDQYRGWQGLVPNREEAAGQTTAQIRRRYRLEAAIVKLDEQGCSVSVRSSGQESGGDQCIAARPREVHDVTGAGDQFLAVLGLGRATGANWFDAARLANLAAGLQVERHGCVPVTFEQLRSELAKSTSLDEMQMFEPVSA